MIWRVLIGLDIGVEKIPHACTHKIQKNPEGIDFELESASTSWGSKQKEHWRSKNR